MPMTPQLRELQAHYEDVRADIAMNEVNLTRVDARDYQRL